MKPKIIEFRRSDRPRAATALGSRPGDELEINPGKGLGPIEFGTTLEELEGILGPPEWESSYDDGSLHLSYDRLGLTLFFDLDEAPGLVAMEVDSSSPCTLLGSHLSPLHIRDVEEILRPLLQDGTSLAKGPVVHLEGDGSRRVHYASLALDLFFGEDNILTELLWGPFIEDENEATSEESADKPGMTEDEPSR